MIGKMLATEQRSAIERWCRHSAKTVAMPYEKTLATVLGEYKMVLDLKDLSVAPHLALDGYWEIWNAMAMAKRVRPGWQVIDVGANFGYFSLLLSELVGPSGRVEAWEPNGWVLESLRLTQQLSGNRFSIVEKAAGDSVRSVRADFAARDYGGFAVYGEEGSDCTMARIDTEYVVGHRDRRADFVKIDAEGSEELVWAGMSGLVARGEPKAILMEWSPWRYRAPTAFLREIQSAGFRVGVVDGSGDIQAPVGDITSLTKENGHLDLWLER